MREKAILQIPGITLIVAFLSLNVNLAAQDSKVNFSGTWLLNVSKSNFGESFRPGGFGSGDFTARQELNLLTVERTYNSPNGESRNVTNKYTLDGKECINSTGRGESKSYANWSADGKSLTILTIRTFERNGQKREIKSTEVWGFTSPGTLEIVTTMQMRDGERKFTGIYDKQ